MTIENSRNQARDVLDRIDRAERRYKLAFLAAAVVEALTLLLYLALADFSQRTHVLLLVAMVAPYTIVGIGLMALDAHINRNTLRILRAIQIADHGRSRPDG